MGLVDLSFLVATLMLISFVLGASVMWSLESKAPRAQPMWLVVARHLAMVGIVATVFFRPGATEGQTIIDPSWTTALGIVAVVLASVAFAAEVRQRLVQRDAQSLGGDETA